MISHEEIMPRMQVRNKILKENKEITDRMRINTINLSKVTDK